MKSNTWRHSLSIVISGLVLSASCLGQSADASTPVLDSDVVTLHAEPMTYPLYGAAHGNSIEGIVVVRASINSAGQVTEAHALSGPKGFLTQPVENAKRWRFVAGTSKEVFIVYWFRRSGVCEPGCPSGFEFHPPNLAVVTVGIPVATR